MAHEVVHCRVDGLFRSSRPDYIETPQKREHVFRDEALFRSSRPDYIETCIGDIAIITLRYQLFRSSRPDYIETR